MKSLKVYGEVYPKKNSKMFNALSMLLCATSMPVIAQTEQLQTRRAAMEQAYQQDMAVCYQRFDVVSCRNEAREKRIATNAALRKDELAHNASERQRAADEAQRRADEKLRDAQQKAMEAAAHDASPSSQSHPLTASTQTAKDNSQRAAYEQKQREAAERRDSMEKRLRERNKPPAAPLPLPEAAK
jgi:hypothetical protein